MESSKKGNSSAAYQKVPEHELSMVKMPDSPRPSPDDFLPSNVSDRAQLRHLPQECLNPDPDDIARPLRHVDDLGNEYYYALEPMSYSVLLILMVELLERFSFYGIFYTQTMYLTGEYDEDWNAGMESVQAASLVSMSNAVAYTTPFIGAILADSFLGDYYALLLGSLLLYLPGILLIALTTIPHLLGDEFNTRLLFLAVVILWPMGTGIVKSVVNVFGAKQFHPILQSGQIASYYVNFYMCTNVGALAGIGLIPILAQSNVTVAYFVPVSMLTVGMALFVSGTKRYVKTPPRETNICSNNKHHHPRKKNTGSSDDTIPLSTVFRVTLLIVPFCIGYNQMPTTFIVQGTVMKKAFGVIDAASMNCCDALSVLVFGYLTGNIIYPALAARNIKIPTTYKFAMGSFLASLAVLWGIYVEHLIHSAYHNKSQVSVLWQGPSYVLIGWGEIFAVSAAYEVAFTSSPPEKKVIASAVNIFCIGGISNVLCLGLFQLSKRWFLNSRGDTSITHIEDYATAHISNYFWVLFAILILGIIINLLPWVRDFVQGVEETAADIIKTPTLRKHTTLSPRSGEESPLLATPSRYIRRLVQQRQQPVLYRMGSLRAGASLSDIQTAKSSTKGIKYKYIPKLYHSTTSLQQEQRTDVTPTATLVRGPRGHPVKAGAIKSSSRPNLWRLESS